MFALRSALEEATGEALVARGIGLPDRWVRALSRMQLPLSRRPRNDQRCRKAARPRDAGSRVRRACLHAGMRGNAIMTDSGPGSPARRQLTVEHRAGFALDNPLHHWSAIADDRV